MQSNGETVCVVGITMPVIARLEKGWLLAAHKNGPCVTDGDSLYQLDSMASEDCGVDATVRIDAIRAYRESTWHLFTTRRER